MSTKTSVGIADIEYYLPGRIESNDDLERENPSWAMDRVVTRSGVFQRHTARSDETALDLAVAACDKLVARHERDVIDGLIVCTQTPDFIMPSNAFLLHRHLGLRDTTFAFDYNLACSGFVYGLGLAEGLIRAGRGREILLVTTDTYSKLINPRDRAARTLFGDGAAATLVTIGDTGRGIIDVDFATSGAHFDRFFVPAGGWRRPRSAETAVERVDSAGNVRSDNDIQMDGLGVWTFVNDVVPKQVRRLLARNRLSLVDVDLVVFHQASQMTLDSLVRALQLKDRQVFSNLARVGNTVSSSIPMALRDAWDAGRIHRGDIVLLVGFGVGLSAASLLMEAAWPDR